MVSSSPWELFGSSLVKSINRRHESISDTAYRFFKAVDWSEPFVLTILVLLAIIAALAFATRCKPRWQFALLLLIGTFFFFQMH